MTDGFGRDSTGRQKHSPGTAAGESSLSGAVSELHKQHPHPYTETQTTAMQKKGHTAHPKPADRKAVL